MPRRIDGHVAPMRRHLRLAQPLELPSTLYELAGQPDVGAALKQNFGSDILWLMADTMHAYRQEGDDLSDYFTNTAGLAVPVRYQGVRTHLEEELDDSGRWQVVPKGKLAVFEVSEDELAYIEQFFNHVIYSYPEVAIGLGQKAALLEYYEFNALAQNMRQRRGRPYLV